MQHDGTSTLSPITAAYDTVSPRALHTGQPSAGCHVLYNITQYADECFSLLLCLVLMPDEILAQNNMGLLPLWSVFG